VLSNANMVMYTSEMGAGLTLLGIEGLKFSAVVDLVKVHVL